MLLFKNNVTLGKRCKLELTYSHSSRSGLSRLCSVNVRILLNTSKFEPQNTFQHDWCNEVKTVQNPKQKARMQRAFLF